MKPILYDANETAFTSQGIGVLNDCIECTCDEETNGMFECSLVYPISGQFYSEIKKDRFVLAKASNLPTRKLQPFRIYKITKPINGRVTAYARHISYWLNHILVRPFTADTPSAALSGMALAANRVKSTDTCPFTFTYDGPSDPVNYNGGEYAADAIAPIRSRLGGSEGSLLDIWHGEFEWDMWDVIYHVPERNSIYARGQNRGVVFRYGGNITDMTQESDIGELITRVYPYCHFTVNESSGGSEELSSGETTEYSTQQRDIYVELDEKYVDASTINNFSYPRIAMLDLSNELDNDFVEECLDGGAQGMANLKAAMRDIANEYIALQGVANENNQISFVPPDDIVELCDVVAIENEMLGVSTTTKIRKVSYNVLLEEYNSIEIGDLKSDFTESISSQVQNNTKEIAERYRSLEVDILKANGVVTDQLNAHTAQIGNLTADNASIRTLVAQKASIADLTAARASIGDLDAAMAKIGDAVIGKATIGEIKAATGYIQNMQADYLAVKTLLNAGTAVIGQLQTIQLTASNTTVQQSFVDTIMANHAIIQNLIAGRIAAGQIDTQTDVGGIRVVGNTIQVFEKNGNTETVRMQIGKDGNGNFTFTILGSDGQSVLIDETGIHSAGIPDGVIIDDMVAPANSSTGYSGIGADKLDINDVSTNVVTNINGDPTKTIKSTQIYFDNEQNTLNALWSTMTSRVQSAENAAQAATDALSGIDTLSSVNMVLTNDTSIVQTNSSGTTDYTGCSTEAKLYYGNVDITLDTTHVSNWRYTKTNGISGTWLNTNTKSYTVTGMSVDSGYVEISADYQVDSNSDPITLTKRFNVIKLDYNVETPTSYFVRVDPKVMYRKSDGTWPAGIKMVRFKRVGSDVSNTGAGTKLRLSYSTDGGVSYTAIRTLTTTAATAGYNPSNTLNANTNRFKIELLETANNDRVVDTEIIHVSSDVGEIDTALQTLSNDYASTVTGPNGLVTRVGGTETAIQGVTNSLNKMLLYNITHVTNNNNTTTLNAHVWKEGVEVTSSFAASQFTWFKRDDSGETSLGTGSSITVNNSDFVYSGVVVGRLTVEEE